MRGERASLLRDLSQGHASVSYLELFLDLVYVFAITQLSQFLLTTSRRWAHFRP